MASAGLITDAIREVENDLERALDDRREAIMAKDAMWKKARKVGLTRDEREDAERDYAHAAETVGMLTRRIPALTRRHVALQDALAVNTGD